jgi:hypothetical protein
MCVETLGTADARRRAAGYVKATAILVREGNPPSKNAREQAAGVTRA